MDRLLDLTRFYTLLEELAANSCGAMKLADCGRRTNCPVRGVYFFFEDGETRSDTGKGSRVVRVGTHALINSSRTTLWTRLSQHQGTRKTGGGNHRGSVFRKHVGGALLTRTPNIQSNSWGKGNTAPASIRLAEQPVEMLVSDYLGRMLILWLAVEDEPGPNSIRATIERNSIALLSNYQRQAIDPPSANWLGHASKSARVRLSGLWNSNHVDQDYDSRFLDRIEALIGGTQK